MKKLISCVEIELRIFHSCLISNCSAERSFSVLKRVKFYLRSRTTDDRLIYLAVLTIESCLTKKLDYDDENANEKVMRGVSEFCNSMSVIQLLRVYE